jgi:hypothetical protein
MRFSACLSAKRRGTDVNSLIRDFVCAALAERAEAIRRFNAEHDERRRSQ